MRKLFVLLSPVLMFAFLASCSQQEDLMSDATSVDEPVVRVIGNRLEIKEGYEIVLTKKNGQEEVVVIKDGSQLAEVSAQIGKFVCGCDDDGKCKWERDSSNSIECVDDGCDGFCTVVEVKKETALLN